MALEVTGKIHIIGDTVNVSDKFTKREFVVVLDDNPKYPQFVQFQLTGDRVNQIDAFEIGDEVRIEFSLRGREWRSPKGEVKHFNSLDVRRIDPTRGDYRRRDPEPPPSAPSGGGGSCRDPDDLPF